MPTLSLRSKGPPTSRGRAPPLPSAGATRPFPRLRALPAGRGRPSPATARSEQKHHQHPGSQLSALPVSLFVVIIFALLLQARIVPIFSYFPFLTTLLAQALCRVSKRLRQRSLPPPPPTPKHEFSLPRPSAYTSVGMQAPAPRVVASDYYKKYIKSIYEREPMFKVRSHRITPLSYNFAQKFNLSIQS